MEITKRIAEYVTNAGLEDFPPEAIQAAKGAIMDCLGCMLAGSREPLAQILVDFVGSNGGNGSSSIVGRGVKAPAAEAALVNGAMAHALDYDDITRALKGHPSAVLVPAALALAEEEEASGRELLLAYILGFEVACSVGEAMSVAYSDDLGWHPTGPLGHLGAAAKLVKAGFTASLDALEGRFGFMHAFSGGAGYDAGRVLQTLGKECYLVQSGIEIKKYPCCGSAHLALDATHRMLEGHLVEPMDVDRIVVLVDFDPPRSLIHDRPKSALEGKFSMQYCLAAALLDRKTGMDSFTDEQVMRPEVQALIPKITMRRIPGYEGQPSWTEAYNQVEVHLKDGSVVRERSDRIKEGALRGATMDEIAYKFRDCAAVALTPSATEELVVSLGNLEEVENVRALTDLLRGG